MASTPPTVLHGPMVGAARSLSILAGNRNHRRSIPEQFGSVASEVVEPDRVLIDRDEPVAATDGYESFDTGARGWTKVAPTAA